MGGGGMERSRWAKEGRDVWFVLATPNLLRRLSRSSTGTVGVQGFKGQASEVLRDTDQLGRGDKNDVEAVGLFHIWLNQDGVDDATTTTSVSNSKLRHVVASLADAEFEHGADQTHDILEDHRPIEGGVLLIDKPIEENMCLVFVCDEDERVVARHPAPGSCPYCGGKVQAMDVESRWRFCFLPLYFKTKRRLYCTLCTRKLVVR